MDAIQFIDKKKLEEKEFLYDVFYKHGMSLLQKYCGDVWTDYNLHDPGITIFEQLCYALTELHYKSTFPVEDYFSEKNNRFEFSKLGLQYPEQIIPNACVTINDLRRVFFDEISEIGNIWIEHHETPLSGLYRIYVDIADQLTIDGNIKNDVCRKILNVFSKWRNLGEDIEQIIILERSMMELHGTVEVHTMRPAWEVCGEIYATCAEYVASNMHYRSVKELHSAGCTLPELFDGPPLKNGIIPESDLTTLQRMICISEMAEKIKAIDGVVDVYNLSLRNEETVIEDCTRAIEGVKVKSVKLPRNNEEIYLKLVRSGHVLQSDYSHIIDEVRKKLFNDPKYPDYLADIKRMYDFSSGKYHQFDDYYSIQNDFPLIYGISEEGVPAYAMAQDRLKAEAGAKQLKAYLWLFEQIIADVSSSLQNVKNVMSADPQLKNTLFCNYLDNKKIPDIELLYTDPGNAANGIKKSLALFDRFDDRRNAVLDKLLGLYGLEFSQISLNKMRKKGDISPASEAIINNKIRYLSYAPLITGRLGKGTDYVSIDKKRSEVISGIELQVLLRTGNDPENIDNDEQMLVIEHLLLRPLKTDYSETIKNFCSSRVTLLFPGYTGRYSDNRFRTLVMQIVEKAVPAHLFVNYVWCNEKPWMTIAGIHEEWCRCTREGKKDRKDELAKGIIGFIIENGGL
jgi:hypothetical protein